MNRIRLTIEYDGTAYVGWQSQPVGATIQQSLEKSLHEVARQPVSTVSSGRTDAGVHARAMIVHFDTPVDLPMSAWREGVNRHLPDDIAVQSAEVVPNNFHARYDALAKHYRYTIFHGAVRSPLKSRYSWHIKRNLDVKSMQRAAADMVGRHDFGAFRSSGCDAKTTIRQIYAASFGQHGNVLYFDVVGNGFLRNMVRVIVGTLVEIGTGQRCADVMEELLHNGCRDDSGVTAPPQGLCLMQVWYDGDPEAWSAVTKPGKNCTEKP